MAKQFFIHPDGSRTEVETPDPPRYPLVLSARGFQDACETGLGGRARFGAVIRDMRDSNDDEVLAVYERYRAATTFDKARSGGLLSVLAGKSIVTASERAAVLAAWPEG